MDIEKIKAYMPYAGILGAVLATLIILFILIDSFILPIMIHDVSKVTVPNIIGKKFHEAQNILESEDLQYKTIIEQYSDDYPANYIINQNPKPNTVVKSGRHILLTVSKGGEAITMPNVTNRPLRSARVELMQKGLYIGNIDYSFNDSIGVDTVIYQSVRGGREINFGTYINLTVSKGPDATIRVPQLVGKTLNEVEDILLEYELQLGAISNTYEEVFSATYLRNTVVNQFPKHGEMVSKNTKIDITIFR